MVLSIPLEFYNSNPSEELKRCLTAHEPQVMNCTMSFFKNIKDVYTAYGDLLRENPQALPDPAKKILCCAANSFESCVIQAVSPTPGCKTLYQQYVKKTKQQVKEPFNISLEMFCIEFPKGSAVCQ